MKTNEYCGNCRVLPFVGRILLALIFFLSGISKIFSFQENVQMLEQAGAHTLPQVLIGIAMVFEIVGGLLLILGWHTKIGSLLLLIFLIPVTLTMHAFWHFEGVERVMQIANFMKNIAIFGGLLLLYSYGPGQWSVDAQKR